MASEETKPPVPVDIAFVQILTDASPSIDFGERILKMGQIESRFLRAQFRRWAQSALDGVREQIDEEQSTGTVSASTKWYGGEPGSEIALQQIVEEGHSNTIRFRFDGEKPGEITSFSITETRITPTGNVRRVMDASFVGEKKIKVNTRNDITEEMVFTDAE